jgi:hypothetical protein
MDIRGRCDPVYNKKKFKFCPARYDTGIFHFNNSCENVTEIEKPNADTKRIIYRFVEKYLKIRSLKQKAKFYEEWLDSIREDLYEEEEEEDEEEEEKDVIGSYMGDTYGCVDGECEKCKKCNPLFYWLKKRPIPRQDKAQEALNELTEYKNKYGSSELIHIKSYINGVKYGLMDTLP